MNAAVAHSFWLGAGTLGPGEPTPGIRRLDLNREGQPSLGPFVPAGENPTFVAEIPESLVGGGVAVVNELPEGKITFLSLPTGERLSAAPTQAAAPCHVSALTIAESTTVFVANYGGGTLTVHSLGAEGLGAPTLSVAYADGGTSHPHQAVIDRSRGVLLVPDLGMDVIHVHWLGDLAEGKPAHRDLPVPAGMGPRHLVIAGEVLLVVGELNRTVAAIDFATGKVLAVCPTSAALAGPNEPGPSAIRLSRWGHLVVANRQSNTLGVLSWEAEGSRLELLGEYYCGGVHPRDLEFSGDDRYLVVANQWSDHLTIFEMDPVRGGLERVGGIDTPSPQCVARIS